MGAADELRFRVDRAFTTTRWIVEGLVDEEYFFEPVPGCWSVRRRADAHGMAWGAGEWVCEDRWLPPDPVPFTTIAWRLVHLSAWTEVYRNWTFGDATADLRQFEVPGSAASAVGWLCDTQDAFAAELAELSDGELAELRPAHYGRDLPLWYLVSSIVTEHVHHGAEIGVLRDLKRGAARLQPPPTLPV
jgi:hypothetical protein